MNTPSPTQARGSAVRDEDVKERPILFSAPMVRALLSGAKTQTRRLVKPQPNEGLGQMVHLGDAEWGWDDGDLSGLWRCPYGVPGDRLWVREAFSGPWGCRRLKPREWPVGAPIWWWADGEPADGDWTRPKPSIHMPRWASRLTLQITDVRVERLQDISEADAQAEGITRIGAEYPSFPEPDSHWHKGPNLWTIDGLKVGQVEFSANAPTAAGVYRMLWEHINGDDSWDANPWCWAVTFEVARQS